jgi:prolyl-tRNA editing enzyme YbaK/EbsC (Cys-tRNA(Pro) deacylase)
VTSDPARLVTEALHALGAAYEVLPCDPVLSDTAAYSAAYGVPPERLANTLLIVSKRGPRRVVACVALADGRLDVNGAVRSEMGAPKVSFATGEQTVDISGMELGGVAPFGLPEDVRVLVDARVLACDWVVVGGGSRAVKLRVDPKVFVRAQRTTIVENLARLPVDNRDCFS